MNEPMKDYFNRLAPGWEDVATEYDIREELAERMDLPENALIADIGCGRGVMTRHLLLRNPREVVALDLSDEMIRLARERFAQEKRVRFLAGDLYDLPLPVFDAAVIFNAYPHFTDKRALADRMAELVRKGGVLAICHSRSREVINGRHDDRGRAPLAFQLSVPLREAEREAAEFADYFTIDRAEDTGRLYFIRLTRN